MLFKVGLVVLFLHLLLSPLVFSAATVEVFEYNKVMILVGTAILLAAGAGVRLLGKAMAGELDGPALRRRVLQVLREPVSLGIILFLVSAIGSTIFTINRRVSFYGTHESFAGVITIAAYTVLFYGTRAICREPRDFRVLLFATAAGAAAASIYGLMQLTETDLIRWGRVSNYGTIVRVFATMGHPNFLSAFLLMAFPVLAYFAMRAFRQRFWAVGLALVAAAALDLLMIYASISRGAWMALAGTAFVLALGWTVFGRDRRLGLWVFGGLGASVIIAVIALASFEQGRAVLDSMRMRVLRMLDFSALTQESRGHIWLASIEMWKESPRTILFGQGLDGFQLAFEQYRTPEYWKVEWNGTPTKAHNEALHILATQGLVGAGATLVLTVGLAIAFARAVRRNVPDRYLLVAALAGVVGFYLQNIVSFTVAGCGTLFITYAALLSRLGESSAPWTPPADAASKARFDPMTLGLQGLIWAGAGALIWFWLAIPFEANSLARLGGSHLGIDDTRTAIEALRRAVQLDPTKELYFVRLGTALQQGARSAQSQTARRGLLEEAKERFQDAIRLIPENSYNWANLGRLLGEMARESPPMARPEESYAAFEKALSIDKNNAYFYADAATAAMGVGDYQRAYHYAGKGAELYPYFGAPWSQLGLIRLVQAEALLRSGQNEQATEQFTHAARLLEDSLGKEWFSDAGGSGIAASYLSAAQLRLGKFDKARESGLLAVSRAPDNIEAWINLGSALQALGDIRGAHEAFVRGIQTNPNHVLAKQALKALRKRMKEAGIEPPKIAPRLQELLDQTPDPTTPIGPSIPQ